MQLILRPYQKQLIRDVYNSMLTGHRRILAVLPTGAGKTVCFAYMASKSQDKGKRVLFLVHRRELLKQTTETFEKFSIPLDTIEISTIGKTVNRLSDCKPYDFIILDEAHHSKAKTWQRIIDHHPDAYILGLTATPTRLDGKPLGDIYTDMVIGATTNELITDGYLSDYDYYSVQLSDFTKLQVKRGEYDLKKAAEMLNSASIMGDIVNTYKEKANGLKAILFAPTVAMSEMVAESFNRAGINAQAFDGKTPAKKRDQIVQNFKQGKINVLCNCELIGEGFDMPGCDAVIQMRPTQSLSIFLQQCGRALRPRPGKRAIIIDHVANYSRHGMPRADRDWSLAEKISKQRTETESGALIIRTCSECFAVYPNTEPACPVCGAKYEPTEREIKRIKEIELSKINEQEEMDRLAYLKTSEAVKNASSYSDFCEIAKARGYKKGWAWHQAKKLGVWTPW